MFNIPVPYRKGRVYFKNNELLAEVVTVTDVGESIEGRWSGFQNGDEAAEYLLEGCLVRFVDRLDKREGSSGAVN